jgi:plasmid stability protein
MPSFILRDIPEDFWRKVKVKAATDGVTVKAFIYAAIAVALKEKRA